MQALYRKYRSKTLGEIVGQEHITSTLANAIKQDKISHAYLLTGPKGVGKTSIARILAHEINQIPYTDESIHLDIIEIDAASNRRIDEIRDLRDKANIAPTSAKYKVYIIDEVHMLTKEAFNALLKTLEEPPKHVIFILATTELHKLPETIISRTQRFHFKPINDEDTLRHLKSIAEKESIAISDKALMALAKHAAGSFRDSINLLDQVARSGDVVDKDDVERMLGVAPEELIDALLQSLDSGNMMQLVSNIDSLTERGVPANNIAKQLAVCIRQRIINNDGVVSRLLDLLRDLLEVPTSYDPILSLESALFLYTHSSQQGSEGKADARKMSSGSTVKGTATPDSSNSAAAQNQTKSVQKKSKEQNTSPKSPDIETPLVQETATDDSRKQKSQTSTLDNTGRSSRTPGNEWNDVLAEIKKHNNTLLGVLRLSQVRVEESEVTISFAFAFHAKKMNSPDNKEALANAVKSIYGSTITLKIVHDPSAVSTNLDPLVKSDNGPNTTFANETPLVPKNVTDIFGGGEVIQS